MVYPGLQHLVHEHSGGFSAELSDFGFGGFPHEVEWEGVIYSNPKLLRDGEGEVYAGEYTNERLIFTLWND